MKRFVVKIVGIILFLTVSCSIHAQLGITGGINRSSLINGNTGIRWNNYYKTGFQIGAFYDIDLSDKFKFQPGITLLNESSRRFVKGEPGDSNDHNEATTSYSCFIPLVFSYKIPAEINQDFLIDFGLYSSFGLWGVSDETIDFVREKTKLYPNVRDVLDLGLIAGIGYDTKRINYSLRLKYGMRSFNYHNDTPITFLLSLGYKLK
jgi:hypothetical protein